MGCQRHFNMPGGDAEPGLRESEDSDGPVPLGCLGISRWQRQLCSGAKSYGGDLGVSAEL